MTGVTFKRNRLRKPATEQRLENNLHGMHYREDKTMKTTKLITIDAEVDIEISEDDVMRAMFDEGGHSKSQTMRVISNFSVFMKVVPDDQIAMMTKDQKACIRMFFIDALERFVE